MSYATPCFVSQAYWFWSVCLTFSNNLHHFSSPPACTTINLCPFPLGTFQPPFPSLLVCTRVCILVICINISFFTKVFFVHILCSVLTRFFCIKNQSCTNVSINKTVQSKKKNTFLLRPLPPTSPYCRKCQVVASLMYFHCCSVKGVWVNTYSSLIVSSCRC